MPASVSVLPKAEATEGLRVTLCVNLGGAVFVREGPEKSPSVPLFTDPGKLELIHRCR